MKKFIVAALVLGAIGSVEARRHSDYGAWDTGSGSTSQSEHVNGYERRDGTYVQPYERTKADNTLDNNYGTRGNQNPWTGTTGTGPTDYDRQQGKSYGGLNTGGQLGN